MADPLHIPPEKIPSTCAYRWTNQDQVPARLESGWRHVPAERHPYLRHLHTPAGTMEWRGMVLLEHDKEVVAERQALDRDKGWDYPRMPWIMPLPVTCTITIQLSREEVDVARNLGISTEKFVANKLNAMRTWDYHSGEIGIFGTGDGKNFKFSYKRRVRFGWAWLFKWISCEYSL